MNLSLSNQVWGVFSQYSMVRNEIDIYRMIKEFKTSKNTHSLPVLKVSIISKLCMSFGHSGISPPMYIERHWYSVIKYVSACM